MHMRVSLNGAAEGLLLLLVLLCLMQQQRVVALQQLLADLLQRLKEKQKGQQLQPATAAQPLQDH